MYLIPTTNQNNQIHISIMDTDEKTEINDFCMSIIKFQEDDELFVYGFGIDEECSQVVTLRNISNLLIKTIHYTYKVKYINNDGIF